jgi:sulfur-oxidizing protein SoxB
MIKTVLEDVADNLFNPEPYLQQGGDMVRVGGMTYTCRPQEKIGRRIDDMLYQGKPMEAGKTYKVAGWAPVAEVAAADPSWEIVRTYLQQHKTLRIELPNDAPVIR